MKARATVAVAAFIIMAGCAAQPDEIEPHYVSPVQYADYDCRQIRAELARVNQRVVEVTGHQQDEADEDAVATGVGLVLVWPALFCLAGDDRAEELGRLKGQYNALEQAAIKQDCDVAEEIRRQREERQKREEEREQERQRERQTGPRKGAVHGV
jgi:hypothetical protein